MEGAVGVVFATMMSSLLLQMANVGNNQFYPLSRPEELNKVSKLFNSDEKLTLNSDRN